MDRVIVGRIVNTHGINGEVKCVSMTDDPERFDELQYVYLDETSQRLEISNVRYAKGLVYLRFKDLNHINDVEKFKGRYLSIEFENRRELPEDSYYLFDLIGIRVMDENANELGIITNVYQTGANDVYELDNDISKLIPAIKEVVRQVDISKKTMIINKVEGLFDGI
ncbi:MAG: ribosome maturation factor RimM [Eubacteriales bacterium]|nr:ribosome maturation factor RimM [Eubacteriales bacterium]